MPELVAVLGDEPIKLVDRPGGARGCPRQPSMAERSQEFDARAAARRDPAVGPDEVPRLESLPLRKRLDQRLGRSVFERQQRDPAAPVDRSDGTRREAAEPSAAVVQKHGSPRLHGRHPRLRR